MVNDLINADGDNQNLSRTSSVSNSSGPSSSESSVVSQPSFHERILKMNREMEKKKEEEERIEEDIPLFNRF